MARLVNAAESWTTVYTAFARINFSAFDYNTVKQSLLAYIQLYFPEDFNDYIESSEFIAQLELFCYMAELMAYRFDLNAHENFMSTAERQESVLRLANLISYTPTRNLPARGLVKLSSISTTQSVYDSLGNNLANVKIVWNDSSNTNWREQFFLVMNNVLTQPFGTVLPNDRVQVGDVLLELYTLNNSPLSSSTGGPVFTYSTVTQGTSYQMELVPTTLSSNGPLEKRPEVNSLFTLMYANDGLGDGSSTTGFLMYTKQGTLNNTITTFDGVTPNQTYDLATDNINDTDIWVNNVDPNTNQVLTVNPLPTSYTDIAPGYSTTYGYWYQVNTASAQNIIFNTNDNRHQYEVESDANDEVTLIFGDGEMVDIPQGTFQIWYRTSANDGGIIPASAISNTSSSFNYVDLTGSAQTLTFTFSLTSSLLNSSVSEDIEHVRTTAPDVYATQDRMVNAQDYNTYMLQDPSILILTAFNRTFAGESEYIAWYDPSESYANVKLFGDDLALYYQGVTPVDGKLLVVSTNVSPDEMLLNYIQPLLSSIDFFTTLAPIYSALGFNPASLRTAFTSTELSSIQSVLSNNSNQTIYFYFSVVDNLWQTSTGGSPVLPDSTYTYMMVVNKTYAGPNQSGWTIQYASTTLIAQSSTTRFWNTNNGTSTINYDTLNSNQDTVLVLSANIDSQGGILGENLTYNVQSQVISPLTPGLPNLSQLSVLPTDTNGDGIPEDMDQVELFNFTQTFSITNSTPVNSGRYLFTLPRTYVAGYSGTDLIVNIIPYYLNFTITSGGTLYTNGTYTNVALMGGSGTGALATIVVASGIVTTVTITNNGNAGYLANDVLTATIPAGSGFLLTVTSINTISFLVTNDNTQPYYFNEYPPPANPNAVVINQIQVGGNISSIPHTIGIGDIVAVTMVDFVYLSRPTVSDVYSPVLTSDSVKTLWAANANTSVQLQTYVRYQGRYPLNFAWFHQPQDFYLVDPAQTNIIDMYIITVGYYEALQQWLGGQTDIEPTVPTSLDLRTSYATLLNAAMISDTVVLHSGTFMLLFGTNADPTLQATFAVIRPPTNVTLTDNEVQNEIVAIIQDFFDPNYWKFGEIFYFTELATVIQNQLAAEIDSIVIVPSYSANQFGDLFQISPGENQLMYPDISTSQINIVTSYTPQVLRQAGY